MIINKLSLLIPTKNDHLRINQNLLKIINFLKNNIENFEILIISNGSTKDSIEYINNLTQNYEFVKHIVIKNSGKGLAIKVGLNEAMYNSVIFIDADCSVEIHELSKFIKNGKLKAPLVIGNRRNANSMNINTPLTRRITGFIYIKIFNFFFKANIEDTQCGFKGIDKDSFKNATSISFEGFSFDAELIILAIKNKIKICQVPVNYKHDFNSKVRILNDSIKMFIDLIVLYKKYY